MAVPVMMTPRAPLPFALFFLLQVLAWPAVLTQNNDLLRPLLVDTCTCCNVDLTSSCCLDCLAGRRPEREDQLSALPAVARDPKEKYRAESGEAANSVPGQWQRWSQLSSPGCHCCSKDSTTSSRSQFLLVTCCFLCQASQQPSDASSNVRPRNLASSSVTADESRDVAKRIMSGHPQKRMTSMDCMCCMNSGISDCCSKCKIF